MMRALDTSGFAALTPLASFGPAPQLQWIKVADLIVDDAYQRPFTSSESRKNIRSIAAAFSWLHFAPVIVSPIAGGRYAIIDGQHRSTAAALCGIEILPCNVVLADQRQQADAFRAINGSTTAVSTHQIYKARLLAGEPEALRIEAVVRAADVRIRMSNLQSSRLKPDETLALNVITRAIKAHGDAVTTLALRSVVTSAGPDCNGLRALVIQAFVKVLAANRDWRRHRDLQNAMANFDVIGELEQAHLRCKRVRGTTTSLNLQAALTDHLGNLLDHPRLAQGGRA